MWIADEDGTLINLDHARCVYLQDPAPEQDITQYCIVAQLCDDEQPVVLFCGDLSPCQEMLGKLRRKLCLRLEN